MPTFKDNLGREWTIEITGIEVKLLRKELNVDLLSVFDKNARLMERLAADPVLLIDVISVLLSPQITKLGLDERGFALGLIGDGLQNAADALVGAIALFSRPHQRGMIQTMWDATKTLETESAAKVNARAPEIMTVASKSIDRELDREMQKLTTRLEISNE